MGGKSREKLRIKKEELRSDEAEVMKKKKEFTTEVTESKEDAQVPAVSGKSEIAGFVVYVPSASSGAKKNPGPVTQSRLRV
jgi:hypothetical protein